MNVIDVSKWNGNIDFAKVKADGVGGAVIRIGFTGYGVAKSKKIDPMFETNYARAKAAGLNVGGYWYSCGYTEAEAKEEAQETLKIIAGKQFELPIYIDIEDAHNVNEAGAAKTNQLMLGKKALTDVAVGYCHAIETAGYYAGIYASKSWFDSYLDYDRIKRFTLWVAHWTTAKLDYSDKFAMWQHSSKYLVNGISGNVDMNKCYVDFPSIIKEAGLNGFQKITEDWRALYNAEHAKYKVLEEQYKALENESVEFRKNILAAIEKFEEGVR